MGSPALVSSHTSDPQTCRGEETGDAPLFSLDHQQRICAMSICQVGQGSHYFW